jgi:hypothetical protein
MAGIENRAQKVDVHRYDIDSLDFEIYVSVIIGLWT